MTGHAHGTAPGAGNRHLLGHCQARDGADTSGAALDAAVLFPNQEPRFQTSYAKRLK